MVDLKGKKVLMFSPYGATKHYGIAIKNELERRGALVVSYDERPSQSVISKLAIRLLKDKLPGLFENYIRRVVKETSDLKFDFILICRGEAFTPEVIDLLRRVNPSVKIILYLWDMLTCLNKRSIISSVDKAMSFDPDDCASEKKLVFRPTFFIPQYAELPDIGETSSDVIFMGSLYRDCNRYAVVDNFRKKLSEFGIKLTPYFFMPSFLVFIRNRLVHHPSAKLKEVTFTPISIPDYLGILKYAKAVLDVNYSGQRSLSTRAYECMAARRKYITTNEAVKSYDFYDPNNILVVNADNPEVPIDFLNSPFIQVPEELLYKYSVNGLVDDLFRDI